MKLKPVLFYHNIGNINYKSFSSIDDFDSQMRFLHDRNLKSSYSDELGISGDFSVTFDDGYEDNLINALPILKKYNFTATCFIVPKFIGKTNAWDAKQFKLMDRSQIKEWICEGMGIGSHSYSHSDLTKINKKQIESEVEKSKKYLEDEFQIKINSFCYPYGKFNDVVINALKQNHYKRAFTTSRGLFHYKKSNLFKICRVPISKSINKLKFWLKTRTIYENL